MFSCCISQQLLLCSCRMLSLLLTVLGHFRQRTFSSAWHHWIWSVSFSDYITQILCNVQKTSKHIGLWTVFIPFYSRGVKSDRSCTFFNHFAVTMYVTMTQTVIVLTMYVTMPQTVIVRKVRCIFNRLGSACSEYYTPSKHLCPIHRKGKLQTVVTQTAQ